MRKLKRIAILALILAAALILSGCMKMHINIVWNEDNSATVSLTYGIQKSAIEMMGSSEDEIRESLRESMADDDGFTFRDYSDSEYVGVIGTLILDDITKDSTESIDSLRFRCEVDGKKKTYSVSGRFDGSDLAGEDDLGDSGISLDSIDMQIVIEMPGKVTSHNATEAKGNVLSWTLDAAGSTSIQAESTVGGGGSTLLWILLIVLVVILIGIGAAIMILSKKKKAAGQGDPQAFGGQPPYGQAPVSQPYQAPGAYQQPQGTQAPPSYGSPVPQQQYAPPAYTPPEQQQYAPPQQQPQQYAPPAYAPPPVPAQGAPRCPQCGAEIPPGSRFCPVCGAASPN